ncbi:MAG: hypothetical protein HZC26_01005 [Candidatus Magasanikbacteria bacterium]|nr:hypothetical protein [Candidatus Magasanikbacteria bacterium]
MGTHQIKNAILCIEVAKHLEISQLAIQNGISRVHQPLRMEIVSKNPLIILDGAHNPDKMRTTVETVQKCISTQVNKYQGNKKLTHLHTYKLINLHLVVGFSADKNISRMIKQLTTLKPKTIAVTRNTTNPFRKVADPQSVSNQFQKLLPNSKIKIFLNPSDALAWSKSKTKTGDILLVTGSIFVSGELRQQF